MHCCSQLCCSCVCVCSFSPNLASLALSLFTSTVTCQKIWSLFHTPAINLIKTCMFNFAHVPFHSSIHFLTLLVLHSTLWRGSSLPWLGGYGGVQSSIDFQLMPELTEMNNDSCIFTPVETLELPVHTSVYFWAVEEKKKNLRREGNSTVKGPSWSETHNPPNDCTSHCGTIAPSLY